MKVVVTDSLLEAVARASSELESQAVRLRHSKDYEASLPEGVMRKLLDDAIEQSYQDCNLISGWLKRVKEQQKQEK